jgi:hypothetical protein
MASQYGTERDRGAEESRQQIEVLGRNGRSRPDQASWHSPAGGWRRDIAAAMNWSLPYTLGVLACWKMAPAYCRSILSHDQRIARDGTPAEASTPRRRDWRRSSWRGSKRARRRARRRRSLPACRPAPPPEPPRPLRDQCGLRPAAAHMTQRILEDTAMTAMPCFH